MKCPDCGTNRKYKDGMTCGCGYHFVLDPKSDDITDGKFLGLVAVASGNDTYFFTENQLYTVYCSRKYFGPMIPAAIAAVFFGLAVGLWIMMGREIHAFALIPAGVGVLCVIVALNARFSPPPDKADFHRILNKWRGQKGNPDKLLEGPALHEPPPEWQEPDIYDYGVERLVVVQRDLLVDLFVKNDFHAEQRALIVAESGYPQYLVPLAVKALTDNPQLPVFYLHDATDEGVEMAARLGQSGMLAGEQHLQIDLGLFPQDVERIPKLKALKPQKVNNQLAVDVIPYAVLSAMLTQALAEQISLGQLLVISSSQFGDGDGGIGFG
ncbi:MAG: hypothetical protein OES79_14320 [Planctomycetota bacterium]|nr:hypothetical protein [Planctomycetota bacterium]